MNDNNRKVVDSDDHYGKAAIDPLKSININGVWQLKIYSTYMLQAMVQSRKRELRSVTFCIWFKKITWLQKVSAQEHGYNANSVKYPETLSAVLELIEFIIYKFI